MAKKRAVRCHFLAFNDANISVSGSLIGYFIAPGLWRDFWLVGNQIMTPLRDQNTGQNTIHQIGIFSIAKDLKWKLNHFFWTDKLDERMYLGR